MLPEHLPLSLSCIYFSRLFFLTRYNKNRFWKRNLRSFIIGRQSLRRLIFKDRGQNSFLSIIQ